MENSLYITVVNSKGYIKNRDRFYPINENYFIQNTRLECSEKSFPDSSIDESLSVRDLELVFLEQSFEPIRRIKRGKFYLRDKEAEEIYLSIEDTRSPILKLAVYPKLIDIESFKFRIHKPSEKFDLRKTFVFFGNDSTESKWKILGVDPIITNEEVYSLQEVNGTGATPILDEKKILPQYFEEVKGQYQKLLSELHVSPESVIDHCRDVTVSLITALLNSEDPRQDLGDLIKKIGKERQVILSCATIINRFHPRRKPNEQEKYGLIALTTGDADFAVQCVFQIIKELNWSKN